MREWTNEAGWRIQLRPVTAIVYIVTPQGHTMARHYDWWERGQAVFDAEAMAEALGLEEVEHVGA